MGSLFSGPKAPPPPAAPTLMPTPDSDAMAQARKRKVAADMSRSGRVSTILSDSDTLG